MAARLEDVPCDARVKTQLVAILYEYSRETRALSPFGNREFRDTLHKWI